MHDVCQFGGDWLSYLPWLVCFSCRPQEGQFGLREWAAVQRHAPPGPPLTLPSPTATIDSGEAASSDAGTLPAGADAFGTAGIGMQSGAQAPAQPAAQATTTKRSNPEPTAAGMARVSSVCTMYAVWMSKQQLQRLGPHLSDRPTPQPPGAPLTAQAEPGSCSELLRAALPRLQGPSRPKKVRRNTEDGEEDWKDSTRLGLSHPKELDGSDDEGHLVRVEG